MPETIEAHGVRVHNLQNVDVQIPIGQLTVICGVSGSGKSSLAFDTLYAEGQRRYVECFSAWDRMNLDQLPRPDVDRVEHIPPAVAIRQHYRKTGTRATVGTATEIDDYLRMLFSRVGERWCPDCDQPIVSHSADDVASRIAALPAGRRFQIGFEPDRAAADWRENLRAAGLNRLVIDGQPVPADNDTDISAARHVTVVLDRLKTGATEAARLLDSIEAAFELGNGRCVLLFEKDGRWVPESCFQDPGCPGCGQQFGPLTPGDLSFNSPRGACEECEGFGSVTGFSFEKLVPDDRLSLREGAVVAWTTPAYRHELDELLELADDYQLPVDIPFRDLQPEHLRLIADGVPERNFGGLRGFFAWLHRNRYKKGVAVFLSRWRSFRPCEACGGRRLNRAALAVRIGTHNITDITGLPLPAALDFLVDLPDQLPADRTTIARPLVDQLAARLGFLIDTGLPYLTASRPMRTLSAGEAQRVSLTSALGSSLVNTLYVLDEPTAGLHSRDTQRVIAAVRRLRDLGNTIVVVEHDPEFIRVADHVIEVGPGAGADGGEIVFCGTPAALRDQTRSATARCLQPAATRPPGEARIPRGWLTLSEVATNNIRGQTVRFPVGALCVVAGVSGAGKSSLVEQSLIPALCRSFGRECSVDEVGEWSQLDGADQIADFVLIDQKPIGRSPRSVPATCLKVFGEIRKVFAEAPEARKRGFTPGTFSFNSSSGGRCSHCEGAGEITIDMQFMADVSIPCPECDGSRYRPEVLEVRYRSLTIADVLALTADQAFPLFRGQKRVQQKLTVLRDAGLGYLPLGQPAPTLSGGEAQRLKVATHLALLAAKARKQTAGKQYGTLFVMDEPTIGLHGEDVAVLLNCLDRLLEAGHSLLVIEHHPDIIRAADHIIELGPDAGEAGGNVVFEGTLQQLLQDSQTATAATLRGQT